MKDNYCDKSVVCCATCMYWGGERSFDGLGRFDYNSRDTGTCNQVGWKGFGGGQTEGRNQCSDYVPLHR